MSKKKNKKNKITASEQKTIIETPQIVQLESKYEASLNARLSEINIELDKQTENQTDAFQYLSTNHRLYQSIKDYAFGIQREILDGQTGSHETDHIQKANALFFDFENNSFDDGNKVYEMPTCYLSNSNDLHICKSNGIYVDTKSFTPAKLFLTDKRTIDGDISFLSSFEKTIDQVVNGYDLDNDFSCFCMLPESVDLFNTRIRRCLNTNKGKIISIPKSVAITYCYLKDLNVGDRYCVVDLDGLHPVITQLSIGRDTEGNKVILREGFVSEKDKLQFTYQDFANRYLMAYGQKYKIVFSDNEKDNLVNNKQIIPVLSQKGEATLFRESGKIVVAYDENIYNLCLNSFSSVGNAFKNYRAVYVASAVNGIISGSFVKQVSSNAAFAGLSIIRNILLDNPDAVIWKERLPKVSLEVIDESIGRFKTINLIEEDNEGQNIRLSVDEEIELPFKGTITLQKGKKEYYLPLEREIYSEDVNSAKEAYFFDKSFPLSEDVLVELVVKYNYMSDSPIKIYARPKTQIKEFNELPNIWVDRHEIEEYSGPVYEGHPKDIKLPYTNVFTITKNALNRFSAGRTDLSYENFNPDRTGIKIHKDFTFISKAYFFIRSTFDSCNISDEDFEGYWYDADVEEFWDAACEAIDVADSFYGTDNIQNVRLYKQGLAQIMAESIVASWYYDQENESIDSILKYLIGLNKTKILIKLSRCVSSKEDDVYDIFERLAEKLYNAFSTATKIQKYDERITYIRTLSQNCWFSKDWIYMLYDTEFGPQAIQLMESFICDYLRNEEFGYGKTYRDIMEFLVCLTMAKNIDSDMFNPNDDNTRELLENVKKSFETVRSSYEADKLVSRLEMRQDQGPLHGYPNYIYMLIMVLSGEGQVDLVGYRDE